MDKQLRICSSVYTHRLVPSGPKINRRGQEIVMPPPLTGPFRPDGSSPLERTRTDASPSWARTTIEDGRGRKLSFLWILAPLLCCGGPFLVAGLAAVSATTLGTVGGLIALLLLAAGAGIWIRNRRRNTACCPPGGGGTNQ